MSKSKKVEVPARMVLVEWDDAMEDDAAWAPFKKIAKLRPVRVHTIGYVIVDDPDFMTLANSVVQEDATLGGNNVIPRGMIRDVKELSVKK